MRGRPVLIKVLVVTLLLIVDRVSHNHRLAHAYDACFPLLCNLVVIVVRGIGGKFSLRDPRQLHRTAFGIEAMISRFMGSCDEEWLSLIPVIILKEVQHGLLLACSKLSGELVDLLCCCELFALEVSGFDLLDPLPRGLLWQEPC